MLSLQELESVQNELARKYTISVKTKGEFTGPKDYSFNPLEVSVMNEEVLAEIHSKQKHSTYLYYELPFGVEKELIICLRAIVESMIIAEKSLKGHSLKVAAAILLGKLRTEQEVLMCMLSKETVEFINRTEEGLKINQDYEYYKNYYRTKHFQAIRIHLEINNPSIYISVEHKKSTGEGPCSYYLNSKVISTPSNPLHNHIDYHKYTPMRINRIKIEEQANRKIMEEIDKKIKEEKKAEKIATELERKQKPKNRLYIGLVITGLAIMMIPALRVLIALGVLIGVPILTTVAYFILVRNKVIEPIDLAA